MQSDTDCLSISSLDSTPIRHDFKNLYGFINELRDYSKALADKMNLCQERLIKTDESPALATMFLQGKKHTRRWFLTHSLSSPCKIGTFTDTFFASLLVKNAIDKNTRRIQLDEEDAKLFQTAPGAYHWLQVMQLLPNVFH